MAYPPASAPASTVAGAKIPKGTDGESGSGAYLLNWDGEVTGNYELLAEYRGRGVGTKIWKHTLDVFEKIK